MYYVNLGGGSDSSTHTQPAHARHVMVGWAGVGARTAGASRVGQGDVQLTTTTSMVSSGPYYVLLLLLWDGCWVLFLGANGDACQLLVIARPTESLFPPNLPSPRTPPKRAPTHWKGLLGRHLGRMSSTSHGKRAGPCHKTNMRPFRVLTGLACYQVSTYRFDSLEVQQSGQDSPACEVT